MVGILSNYLQGANANQVNEPNAFANYLSGYNVNPYWQQYLPQGLLNQQQPQESQGLLGQAPTGGANNPFNAAPINQTPQTQAPAKSNLDGVKISGFLGSQPTGKNVGGQGYRHDAVTLSNGMTIPMSKLNDYILQAQRKNAADVVGQNNGSLGSMAVALSGGRVGDSVSAEILKALGYGG